MIDIKELNQLLEKFSGVLDQGNEVSHDEAAQATPPDLTTKTVGDGTSQPYGSAYNFLSTDDSLTIQRQLNRLPMEQKSYLMGKQLAKGAGRGIPLQHWQAAKLYESAQFAGNEIVMKALDTVGGAALIRQDLDPFLVSMFISVFPAWARMNKVAANGLVHAWDQLVAYGAAGSSFIPELGTVVDKTGTYVRQTTNIAVYGQRRGVSFKQQLAVGAGGMNWDSARLEIQNGLTQMAADLQTTIFQGNASNSGGTASSELGEYDANAFTGLRQALNNAYAVNASPYLTSSPTNFVTAFNTGITNIANNVAVMPSVAYIRYDELAQLSDQQLQLQRVINTTEFVPGVRVPAIMTSAGELPLVGIPGSAIGEYVASGTFDGKTVADTYLLNEQQVEIPYLGSPGPSVIEIPPGVSGQLTRLYIVWGMFGLAVLSNLHSVKIRNNQATS